MKVWEQISHGAGFAHPFWNFSGQAACFFGALFSASISISMLVLLLFDFQ